MSHNIPKYKSVKALTLLEMVISLAIVSILFSVILPVFTTAGNSWNSRQSSSEAIQNGRILVDYINSQLTKAVKIISVSDPVETNGFIEFEDAAGTALRFDIAASNYVQFGRPGSQSELAGPVTRLQFTCYALDDLNTPITDAEKIRLVKVRAVLDNASPSAQDKTFMTSAYLQTNGDAPVPGIVSSYDYSNRNQGTDIFAYDGQSQNDKQLPSNSTEPSEVLSSGEYDDIESDDGVFHSYSVLSNGNFAQMSFKIQIDEDAGDVTQIDATWNGKCVNDHSARKDGASFYIWNYNSSGFELLEESAGTEAEVTLNGSLSSSIGGYIGGDGADTITLFIVSNGKRTSKDCELFTDYIKLQITTGSSGGMSP